MQEFRALLGKPFRIVADGGEEFTLSEDLIRTVLGKLTEEKNKTDSTKELSKSSENAAVRQENGAPKLVSQQSS